MSGQETDLFIRFVTLVMYYRKAGFFTAAYFSNKASADDIIDTSAPIFLVISVTD